MSEGPTGAEGKHPRRSRATRRKAREDRTDLVAGLQLHGQTMKGWIQSTMRSDRSGTLSVYRCVLAFETFVLPFARNESGIRPLLAPILVLSGGAQHEIEPHSHDFSSCVDPFARLIIRLLSWMMCRWVRIDSEGKVRSERSKRTRNALAHLRSVEKRASFLVDASPSRGDVIGLGHLMQARICKHR